MESEEIQKRLSENLRKIRKANKMTQFDLAVECDLSEAMIKNIELNRSWPSEKTLSQITKALHIDVYNLFLPVTNDFSEKKEIRKFVKEEVSKVVQKIISEEFQIFDFD